jgi:hypothetical protein
MAEIQVGSIVIIHFQFSTIQKIRKLRFKPCDCGMCLSHLCKECVEGRGGARFSHYLAGLCRFYSGNGARKWV